MPSSMPERKRYQDMTPRQKEKHLAYAKVYRVESTASRNMVKILISLFLEVEEIIPQHTIDRTISRMNETEMRLFQKWALLNKVSATD